MLLAQVHNLAVEGPLLDQKSSLARYEVNPMKGWTQSVMDGQMNRPNHPYVPVQLH